MIKQLITVRNNRARNEAKRRFFAVAAVCLAGSLLLGASSALAQTLNFSPSSGTYKAGQTFTVSVYVANAEQAMNAASGVISFPPDKLSVTSVSKSGSIFNLWVQNPSFNNSAGTVNFEGIVLNPGYSGSWGKLLSVNFKAKSAGSADISFSSGSILANDGSGTNILSGLGRGSYKLGGQETVAETEVVAPEKLPAVPQPQIASLTHPDQNAWYADNNPKFSWTVPSGVTAVRIAYNKNSSPLPAVAYSPAITSKDLSNIGDGSWYFHAQFKTSDGWSAASDYRFQIDRQPPQPFSLSFVEGDIVSTATPSVLLKAIDDLSGIDHYSIKIDGGDAINVSTSSLGNGSEYKLPPLASGQHYLQVEAYDRAGNMAAANKIFKISIPEQSVMPSSSVSGAVQFAAAQAAPENIGKTIVWILIFAALAIALVIIIIIIILLGLIKIKQLQKALSRQASGIVDGELMQALKLLNDNLKLQLKALTKLSGQLKAAKNDPEVNEELHEALVGSQNLTEKIVKILKVKK